MNLLVNMAALWRPLTALVTLLAGLALAQKGPTEWSATPFNPPSLPLAVRNPYLNTWLAQGNNPVALTETWPEFWSSIVSRDTCFAGRYRIVPSHLRYWVQ